MLLQSISDLYEPPHQYDLVNRKYQGLGKPKEPDQIQLHLIYKVLGRFVKLEQGAFKNDFKLKTKDI